MKIPTMSIGPVHHGSDTKPRCLENTAFVTDFIGFYHLFYQLFLYIFRLFLYISRHEILNKCTKNIVVHFLWLQALNTKKVSKVILPRTNQNC
jgi:hypothetical protein